MSSSVTDILGAFGITGAIASSAALAIAAPTSANVQAVVDAYAQNGQVVPTKLMAYLIEINAEQYPNDLYTSSLFPIVFAVAAIAAYFIFRKRRS